ncbi:hypothetical protein DENIS_3436 [Desulfonema ishimotonii]|uniref:histidine kinase n=1 Tax=Desulfonema ishimotonii TaxID=45657 RepID=A0A401FZR8_9BACT|nr:response regulator [Desulfonema ishimotonii]GBC62464.1 hypothetical protein DENIS_3436 [Desulfonema ishimotonii]
MTKMNLYQKIISGYIAIALLTALFCGLILLRIRDIRQSLDEISVSNVNEAFNATELLVNALRVQSNLRELLIETRENRALEIQRATHEISRGVTKLREVIPRLRSNTQEGKRLSEAEEKFGEEIELKSIAKMADRLSKLDSLISRMLDHLKHGDTESADRLFENAIEPMVREFQIRSETLAQDALREINEESGEIRNSVHTLLTLCLCLTGSVLLFLTAFTIFVASGMARPVKALTEAARQIHSGNFNFRLPSVCPKNELGDLTACFKKLSDELKDRIAAQDEMQAEVKRLRETGIAQREGKARYRLLLENANDAILVFQDRHIQFANPALSALTGHTQTEPDQDIGVFIHPKDRADIFSKIHQCLDGEIINFSHSFRILNKSLGPLWVQADSVRIDWHGAPAILSFIRDITRKKEMASQVRHSKKTEAISTLAGGVAHDLNNILSGIVTYPELLLLDLPGDSPLKNPLLCIKESGEKAAAIVRDLLILSGNDVSFKKAVNLNDLMTRKMARPEYKRLKHRFSHIAIRIRSDPAIREINASPAHIFRGIINLIHNAAESMPDGGEIRIATENRYLRTAFSGYELVPPGNYVVLSVSDPGTDTGPADMEKIFEPFYTRQVMKRQGTGLGMAVVWGIVKDHDGYADVQVREGTGTTVTLFFPAIKPVAPVRSAADARVKYTGNGESVLVVDDEADQREIATAMLTKLGYSASAVGSGEAAVAYLTENSVDLILLDLLMTPGMCGYETYRQILERHPGQKAVVVSGFPEFRQIRRMQKLGAGTCLEKPFQISEMGRAVRKALDT